MTTTRRPAIMGAAGAWRLWAILAAFLLAYLLAVGWAVRVWPDLNRRNFYGMLQRWPRADTPTFGSHFATWDAAHYLYLSEIGYHAGSASCAFYPLFPTMVKGVAVFTGNHLVAGLVCANACLLVALVLCHKLITAQFDRPTASWSLAFLCAFPGSLFFHFIYTEALFLVLLMWLTVAMQRERLLLAFPPAFLLPLTRAIGVFAAVPLLWWAWNKRRDGAGWALALTPLGGAAGYFLWMGWLTGNPFEGWVAQRHWPANSAWHLVDPVGCLRRFAQVRCVHGYEGSMLDRAFFVLVVSTLPILWRVDREWFWWAVVLGLVPGLISSFVSFTRYCAVAFPCFVALALQLRSCRPAVFHWPVLGGLMAIQVWLLWRHVNFVWAG